MDKSRLHITNGDSAAGLLLASSIVGELLPWRDVLHDGPVPGGLSTAALSDVRARFLAAPQIGGYASVRESFRQRDALFGDAARFDEVVLWFEHDLYDQLQLLQILHGLAESPRPPRRLSMICIDRFPGVEPFYGLGQLSPPQMASLFGAREALNDGQLALGKAGWEAFTANDPQPLLDYLQTDLSPLPFMREAIVRFLADYPSAENGLGLTEQRMLQLLAQGSARPVELFRAWQALETAPFLGDWGFWQRISDMQTARNPLIACAPNQYFFYPPGAPMDKRFVQQQLSLTDTGRQVALGEADQVQLNGLDRWYGGVHLRRDHAWRWRAERQTLRCVE